MNKLITTTLIALTVTACAPRNCDVHYSDACYKADVAKEKLFGSYNQYHVDPDDIIVEIVSKEEARRALNGGL